MSISIAINGFGRIGRAFLRALLSDEQARTTIRVVAINLGPNRTPNLDILFKHDSVLGTFPDPVSATDDKLTVNGYEIALFAQADPAGLPWEDLGIDWVVDASGHFTDGLKAQKHCAAGCKKVLITAPASNEDITIIPGVNDAAYDAAKHRIISLGSCTTNCFAPVVKVLHETFGITQGFMTTTHAYTNDQVLLDVGHQDPRRARAAALNIVPTKTGAGKVITKLFPELEGKLSAVALRVPVPLVSMLDFTFTTTRPVNAEAINDAFRASATGPLKGIIQYETQPLVSTDFIGNESSCIIDSLLTQGNGSMGKVFAWYDNEYGYSCRLKDFLLYTL
jgi:glyceraldehyde-3-phosphate dehydrogenase type I